jgi:hypothetical protein
MSVAGEVPPLHLAFVPGAITLKPHHVVVAKEHDAAPTTTAGTVFNPTCCSEIRSIDNACRPALQRASPIFNSFRSVVRKKCQDVGTLAD